MPVNNPDFGMPSDNPGFQMSVDPGFQTSVDPGCQTSVDAGCQTSVDLGLQMPVGPAAAALYSNQPSSSYLPTLPPQNTEFPVPPLGPAAQLNPPNLESDPDYLFWPQQAEQVSSRARQFLSSPTKTLINAKGLYEFLAERMPDKIEFVYHGGQFRTRIFSAGVQFNITSAWCEARQITKGFRFMMDRASLLMEILRYLRGIGGEGFGFMNTPIQYPNITTWYWITGGDAGRGDGVVWPNDFGGIVLRWLRPRSVLEMKSWPAYIKGCNEDIVYL